MIKVFYYKRKENPSKNHLRNLKIKLSSSLEPNDLQYFCEMTLESYLELLNSKDGDTIKNSLTSVNMNYFKI